MKLLVFKYPLPRRGEITGARVTSTDDGTEPQEKEEEMDPVEETERLIAKLEEKEEAQETPGAYEKFKEALRKNLKALLEKGM